MLLFLLAFSATAQNTQGNNQANIGGLLIASNFAQWTVPQGNQGGYTWSSPDFCKVTFAGATFNAFSPGTPVEIVDTGNPANSESVMVNNFASTSSQCSVYVSPTHAHNSFFFRSSTAGLGEALAFAGTRPYQIILTPDWTRLGGITSTITSSSGNTNITISDQRTAQIVPYSWSGSAWVAGSFGSGNPAAPNQAVQFNNSSAFGGDSLFTYNTSTHQLGAATATQANTDNSTLLANDATVQRAQSNVVIVNVKQYGAIGDGTSHQACTYLGLANLTALQAYDGGIYSFATACTNQMDWLATQYAVNKLTAAGGQIKLAAGKYVWDQTVVLPAQNLDDFATAISISMIGDSNGGTFIIPAVADFGPSTALLSCGAPGALYSDNSGSGSGRYTSNGGCPGDFEYLTLYDPYVSGTVNVSSSSYARGIINVPAPSNSGAPVQMDGVVVGARMYMKHVTAWNFRMGFNVVGDHMAWQDVYGVSNFCGMYFAPQSIFLQADLVMNGHDFISGNTFGGFCVDKDAQMNLYQSGEVYVGFQPYGFIKFPGTVDSYLGSGYFGFMEGGSYQNVQAESIGNAVMWDDNLTNSGGGVNTGFNGSTILETTINQLFSTWGTAITTGGRHQYAWIGSTGIANLAIHNPFSSSGSFTTGGAGQLAGILSGYSPGGIGGIDVSGALTFGLSQFTAYPFIGSQNAGFCPASTLHTPGGPDAQIQLLDSTVTSVTAGQILRTLSDGNLGISNGSSPVVGVSAQSLTNSGGGSCLAFFYNGFTSVTSSSSATAGAQLVATTSGNATPITSAGGYLLGTATSSGTSPGVNLSGMGGYVPAGGATLGANTFTADQMISVSDNYPLTLQSSDINNGGTCEELSNTATGGKNWGFCSTGAGFGAGQLILYDFSDNSIGFSQSYSGGAVQTTVPANLTIGGSVTVASARKGTFVCTSGGTITITNANEAVTSDVIISLHTAGGTISTAPAIATVTAGTGFTVKCATSDTSTYNYDILN